MTYVVERRLYPESYQKDFLDRKFDICNKIYNTAVKHYKTILREIQNDLWFQENLTNYLKYKDDKNLFKEYAAEIAVCMSNYKLNEYDIHEYIVKQKQTAFKSGIGINIAQKLGTSLYMAIKKVLFSSGKDIHYRKKGQTCSFEDKKCNSGIIYNSKTDTVKVMGAVINIKPIRPTDLYLQHAMQDKIKYGRIVRKPFKNGYKYFVQFVMNGIPPVKIQLGEGRIGLDPGVSTIALSGDHLCGFHVLADGVEKYDKKIKEAAIKYERRCRLNNPDNYNLDGTIKKGSKNTVRTKGMFRALFELKNAYRKKSVFIRQTHGALTSDIVASCNEIIKEPMNYKALAKRAKETSRQMKQSTVKTATGIKNIRKYKRKKRFGSSINRRSPGLFIQLLTEKMLRHGGNVIDVDIKEYKASQYNHTTKETIKVPLSCRVKEIDGYLVQRDLYSAFLLECMLDDKMINFELCNKKFPEFLTSQEILTGFIHSEGDKTKNYQL